MNAVYEYSKQWQGNYPKQAVHQGTDFCMQNNYSYKLDDLTGMQKVEKDNGPWVT